MQKSGSVNRAIIADFFTEPDFYEILLHLDVAGMKDLTDIF